MTTDAIVLQDLEPRGLHFDGLFESTSREELAMSPAVFCFGQVLRNEALRQVAVHANGRGVVASLLPAVVLGLHDVAVHARLGVRLKIRKSLGVTEGVRADAREGTQCYREKQGTQRPLLSKVSPRSHPQALSRLHVPLTRGSPRV